MSPEYLDEKAQAVHKIEQDPSILWHRTGDMGHFDQQNRLWYCGRVYDRIDIQQDKRTFLPTVPIESIYNEHPDVLQTALVSVTINQKKEPVLVRKLLCNIPMTNFFFKKDC